VKGICWRYSFELLHPKGRVQGPEVSVDEEDLAEYATSACRNAGAVNHELVVATIRSARGHHRIHPVCPVGCRQIESSLQREDIVKSSDLPSTRDGAEGRVLESGREEGRRGFVEAVGLATVEFWRGTGSKIHEPALKQRSRHPLQRRGHPPVGINLRRQREVGVSDELLDFACGDWQQELVEIALLEMRMSVPTCIWPIFSWTPGERRPREGTWDTPDSGWRERQPCPVRYRNRRDREPSKHGPGLPCSRK